MNYFAIPVFLLGLICIVVGIIIYLGRGIHGYRAIAWTVFGIAYYNILYSIEILHSGFQFVELIWKLEYLVIPFIGFAFFRFVVTYTDKSKEFFVKILSIYLIGIAILANLSLYYDPLSSYFYTNFRIDTVDGFAFLNFDPGIIYLVKQGSDLGILLLSVYLLEKYKRKAAKIQSKQIYYIQIALILPFFGLIFSLFPLLPQGLDPNPVFLSSSILFLYLALQKYGFLESLNESREKVFEHISDSIAIFDLEFRLIDFNPSFSKRFLFNQSLRGENIFKIFSEWEECSEYLNTAIFDRKQTIQLTRKQRDTEEVFVIEFEPLYSRSGQIQLGWTLYLRDITIHLENEKKISKQNEKLILLNTEKDRFYSLVAHDLRSPFMGFLGLTQHLVREFDSLSREETKSLLESIQKTSQNIYDLLENLLTWSRLQIQSHSLHIRPIPLRRLIEDSLITLEQLLLKKELQIKVTGDYEGNVYVNEDMILSVLRNLISNAIKFSKRTGTIEIHFQIRDESFVLVTIRDFGIGMDEEILTKLFQTGEKVRQKGTEGEPSSGLGLILCKEFLEKNKGEIWVESRKEFGSTFYFTLPRINFHSEPTNSRENA